MPDKNPAPDPRYVQLARVWRDQLKDMSEEQCVEWLEILSDAHDPEKFRLLIKSDEMIAGENAWLFMLSAAELVLMTHRETLRGVRQ